MWAYNQSASIQTKFAWWGFKHYFKVVFFYPLPASRIYFVDVTHTHTHTHYVIHSALSAVTCHFFMFLFTLLYRHTPQSSLSLYLFQSFFPYGLHYLDETSALLLRCSCVTGPFPYDSLLSYLFTPTHTPLSIHPLPSAVIIFAHPNFSLAPSSASCHLLVLNPDWSHWAECGGAGRGHLSLYFTAGPNSDNITL